MADKNKSEKNPFSIMEEEVLDFWEKNKIFEKSVEKPTTKGSYVFYDGPPFITGTPHYATLLPSIVKDLIPRYFTMKGYRVERVWGWDCHGLPAENKVEEQLGLKNKKDIEELGVDKFVDACREYVDTGSKQWRWYIDRIGRWVDMDNAYRTMDLDFMESVMWAFKDLYKKGLIYEGYRTSLHCPRCATPLSKFEITMDAGSYKDVEEMSVVAEFITDNNLHLLAWTTTPWTLPGNLALAVSEDIDYAVVESLEKEYVLAEEKVEKFFEGKEFKIKRKIKGRDLVGLSYKPVIDIKNETLKNNDKTFKVYGASFVSTEEGTGIVHIAPNFGEEDFNLGKKAGLPMIEIMDENGVYTSEAGEWEGFYFKKANKKVLDDFDENLFIKEKYTHSYPFCHRCKTSLIHKTQKAWYMSIDKVREQMIETNKEINWVPEHFKEGRFKYNLENAPDWCISRSRYWGSPIPIWKCDCGEMEVFGSLKELEDKTGEEIKDLHRPGIDEVTFKCSKCEKEMRRVPEVLDGWFESGSMPFAQFHYPFKRESEWESLFPADFIVEYTGQLRGWFYYLHVLSNSLFNSLAFKNVIVTGVLAGDDGRKMSKSLGNYPDPAIVLNKYGSDALRMYFMSSPIMIGGDMSLKEEDIKDSLRKNVMLFSNVVKFYSIFSEINDYIIDEENNKEIVSGNILDKWIIARLNETIKRVSSGFDKYNTPSACHAITTFISDFSTWYIRRSRNRFKGSDERDARIALKVTGYVIHNFTKAFAPVMPFLAERVWQKITGNNFEDEEKSVHLTDYPEFDESLIDEDLIFEMKKVRDFVSLALKIRDDAKVKVRQPLASMKISSSKGSIENKEMINLIKEEVNVKEVIFVDNLKENPELDEVELDLNITPELKEEGDVREITRTIQNLRKEGGLTLEEEINLFYEGDDFEDILKKWDNSIKEEASIRKIERRKIENPLAKKEINMDGKKLSLSIVKNEDYTPLS